MLKVVSGMGKGLVNIGLMAFQGQLNHSVKEVPMVVMAIVKSKDQEMLW